MSNDNDDLKEEWRDLDPDLQGEFDENMQQLARQEAARLRARKARERWEREQEILKAEFSERLKSIPRNSNAPLAVSQLRASFRAKGLGDDLLAEERAEQQAQAAPDQEALLAAYEQEISAMVANTRPGLSQIQLLSSIRGKYRRLGLKFSEEEQE